MSRPKVAHVTTVAISLRGLLLNQMRSIGAAGYEVVGISAGGEDAAAVEAAGIRHIAVPMTRTFTPAADLVSLWRLYRVMCREGFTIVHTHTPKAGLLGRLAARLEPWHLDQLQTFRAYCEALQAAMARSSDPDVRVAVP